MKTKYDFKEVEQGRYDNWVKNEYFNADRTELKPYTIVIPPPNVTGKLHLGHAWDNTLQDIIIRRKRMQGYNALYLPGMDHAGIATQARVEERLREQGISRYDLGREKFLEVSWEWKEEYSAHIRKQWEALGISVDYSRERFTLDEGLNKAVNYVFIKMYEEGLIYRGNRIIHWDPEAKTALSNIEVENKDEVGKLYHIKYPLADNPNEYLTVATSRPETMFADQAVMVNPEDERYLKYVGKHVYIAGTDIKIPVITDDFVDPEFGTGVVKVTPAHDANDFEVGVRHNLEMPLCMNEDGSMNEMAFEFEGMDRFECRTKLVEKLKELDLFEKIEDYEATIGYSERTGVVVEPRLSLQWFMKMEEISRDALETESEFVPNRFKRIYNHWMTDTLDWTISRQLWWGHRIPAWYKDEEVKVQVDSPGEGWIQDEDVLDTWFSSALWPFSTLGWPDETEDFKTFYPGDVLVTGYDIIFFWVARMIFQGRHFTGKDPFKQVLLHGLIRDSQGRKMSKSLDNGVDPIDVINGYGVDSLRYFLTTNSSPGADLRYEVEKVESSWNFINKLWNISRFVMMNLDDEVEDINFNNLNLFDKWILSRLSEVITEADIHYENFHFNEASHVLYNFIWNEFASWYVELSKISLNNDNYKDNTQSVLKYVLESILKLLHPFIPFVTDSIYTNLTKEETIIRADWPKANILDKESIKDFEIIEDIIVKVRNLRAEYDVAPSKPLDINIVTNKENVILLATYKEYLERFLRTNTLTISEELTLTEETISLLSNNLVTYVIKEDLIDLEELISKLEDEKLKLEKEIARSKGMLSNENFLKRAPEEKVAEEKSKYENYLNNYEKVLNELKEYGKQIKRSHSLA